MSTATSQMELTGETRHDSSSINRHTDDDVPLDPSREVSIIPDGGYGWIVVSSAAVFTFWLNGTTSSWGVVQAALLEQGLTSTSTLSFVGSLSIFCVVAFALLGVRFMRAFGARITAFAGIAMLGIGVFCSGFTTENVGGLFGTTGLLLGTGASLCFMVASVLPAQYFSSKVGLANGLIKAAGGMGGFILSIVYDILIRNVGIAWTFRITGISIAATGLPAAWLIKERSPRSAATFDFSLFKNSSFVAIFIAGAIGTFALFVPTFFIPLFAQSIGLSSSTGAWLVAGFNLCTAVGRLGSGVLCDRLGAVNTFLLVMLVNALSMLAIWPVSSNLATLIIFAVINGMSNGGFFTTMPTVVTNMYGSARAGAAMGMTITGWSAGYLMGAPIAGYLLQAGGGVHDGTISPYRPAIFYAGGIALLASIIVIIARVRIDRNITKKV